MEMEMEIEMEMEMEMRSTEDINIATDITPPLTPLSFSLHNTHLHTHCSSCFSLITPPPIPIPNPNNPPIHYCSLHCSTSHSSIPLSSAEHHLPSSSTSSLLRTALRLLLHRHSHGSTRLNHLLTNRHLLTSQNDDDVAETVRLGALTMATAIEKQNGCSKDGGTLEEATVALCAVLTNAVEVHDNEGCALGIAVFEHAFSWINHSCSPNACYRFSFSNSLLSRESKLRIAPFTQNSKQPQIDSGVFGSSSEFAQEGREISGPKLIVRSIKRIKKGEEVTVAYTDLLQPKGTRQSELWSKYQFICCCQRCSSLLFTYVDHILQEICVVCGDLSGLRSNYKFFRDMTDRRLTDSIEDVISEYLSVGDSVSCCEKLEKILIEGVDEQLEGKAHSQLTLHPLHHLSLNCYMTLASAYKVRASDLLSGDSEIDFNQSKAFDMSRTSAAYFLLLAGAAHHLFNSESSLIASVANFWIGAGESLLTLTRSSGWSKFLNVDLVLSNLASDTKFKCCKWSLMDTFRACMLNGQINSQDFENVSNEFIHSVSDITRNVWSFLVYGCQFLKSCKDPINFGWVMSKQNSLDVRAHDIKTGMCYTHEPVNSIGFRGEQDYNDHTVTHIFQLGVHCLTYGGLLACICYGPHSHLVSQVQNILDHKNDFLFS
ncbi:protein SET DOMAIN GROUP 41 isoform X2 [Medicago truncatula]|uniref:protein SET DOMAIN GROUP 41 isoform X2 n=1 Tax=Medicago truncatula TaxID=3880 RepID=UPI000D2F469D|nr:protein SET DOMAIN GROUP 41 isoform X2 [Medicago truncatula]